MAVPRAGCHQLAEPNGCHPYHLPQLSARQKQSKHREYLQIKPEAAPNNSLPAARSRGKSGAVRRAPLFPGSSPGPRQPPGALRAARKVPHCAQPLHGERPRRVTAARTPDSGRLPPATGKVWDPSRPAPVLPAPGGCREERSAGGSCCCRPTSLERSWSSTAAAASAPGLGPRSGARREAPPAGRPAAGTSAAQRSRPEGCPATPAGRPGRAARTPGPFPKRQETWSWPR